MTAELGNAGGEVAHGEQLGVPTSPSGPRGRSLGGPDRSPGIPSVPDVNANIPKEIADTDFEVSQVSEEGLPDFVSFITGIITASPYYADAQKASILASASVERLADRLSDQKSQLLHVRDTKGEIVGFGVGKIDNFPDAGYTNVGYVSWVGIAEEHRGKGIASSVIATLENGFRMQGASTAVCFIKDANAGSRTRFAREGYVENAHIPKATRGNTGGRFYSKQL